MKYIGVIVVTFFVHCLFSEIGMMFAIPPGFASSIWPAAGITLGLYLLLGSGVIIGAFLGYLAANHEPGMPMDFETWSLLLVFAAAACLQFIVAKWFIFRFCKLPIVNSSLRQVLKLMIIMGPVSCLVASSIATVAIASSANLSFSQATFTWAIWWVGDVTGVLFFTPLVLFLRPNKVLEVPKNAWQIILISVLTFSVIGSLFAFSRDKYHGDRNQKFIESTQAFVQQIELMEFSIKHHLFAMNGLFQSQQNITRQDFRLFTQKVYNNGDSIRALAWLPMVAHKNRAMFESSVKNEGFEGFSILKLDKQGLKPAPLRDYYLPILFTEPLSRNASAMGLDVSTHPVVEPYIDQAILHNKFVISPLLQLAQQQDKFTGVIFYYPVFDERIEEGAIPLYQRLKGLVQVVLELDELLDKLYYQTNNRNFSYRFSYGDHNQLQNKLFRPNALFTYKSELDFFDQTARVEFSSLASFEAEFVDWTSWLVIIGGTLLGVVSTAFIYSMTAFSSALGRSVAIKTRQLTEANQNLKRANQAKSLFLANMSHELRTPMNGVVGTFQLMNRLPVHEESRDLIEQGLLSSQALVSIINDILDFSKIEAGKLELEYVPTNVEKLFEAVVLELSPPAEGKNIRISFKKSESFRMGWHVDPIRLKQIILNLLSNSIKFTESGFINLRLSSQQNGINFTVKDSGIGMTKEALASLFVRFEQADKSTTRKYGGTGLGMAITKQLIEMMNGEIEVKSQPGQGSEFRVSLPLKPCELHDTRVQRMTPQSPPVLPGALILLAEDNKINQTIFTKMLAPTRAKCLIAQDGVEALELFQKHAFDIVFMDIQMPNVDGVEACKRIREQDSQVPIIAVTANIFETDVQTYLKAGFNAHLGKPVELEELYRELQWHCQGRESVIEQQS